MMKGVDWACVNDAQPTAGLNISVINHHLARVELPHGACLQLLFPGPARDEQFPLYLKYCWLYLAADGKCWALERLGPFCSSKGWENLLDLRDFVGEKLPSLRFSWRAYNESRLWC